MLLNSCLIHCSVKPKFWFLLDRAFTDEVSFELFLILILHYLYLLINLIAFTKASINNKLISESGIKTLLTCCSIPKRVLITKYYELCLLMAIERQP